MEYLFIYGLQIANTIYFLCETSIIITILAFFGYMIIGFLTGFTYEDYKKISNYDIETVTGVSTSKMFKKLLIISSVLSLILIVFPSQQTMLLVGGTYLGKKAVNQVVKSDKMEKINTIIDLQLDNYIKELKADGN